MTKLSYGSIRIVSVLVFIQNTSRKSGCGHSNLYSYYLGGRGRRIRNLRSSLTSSWVEASLGYRRHWLKKETNQKTKDLAKAVVT